MKIKDEKQDTINYVTLDKGEYRYIPERLKEDKDITIAAMDENSVLNVLDYMPQKLGDNIQVAAYAAAQMEKVQTPDFTNLLMSIHFSERINKLIDPARPSQSLLAHEKDKIKQHEPNNINRDQKTNRIIIDRV